MEDDDPFDELDLEDALAVDVLMGWDGPICATCGSPLAGLPNDDPTGDEGLPICGECRRARNLDGVGRSGAGLGPPR